MKKVYEATFTIMEYPKWFGKKNYHYHKADDDRFCLLTGRSMHTGKIL